MLTINLFRTYFYCQDNDLLTCFSSWQLTSYVTSKLLAIWFQYFQYFYKIFFCAKYFTFLNRTLLLNKLADEETALSLTTAPNSVGSLSTSLWTNDGEPFSLSTNTSSFVFNGLSSSLKSNSTLFCVDSC